jgi:hypothetical protein
MQQLSGLNMSTHSSEYEFRLYRTGDEQAINAMFNEVFRVNRHISEWRWKYSQNPCGTSCIALACTESNELVAHYAAYPLEYLSFDNRGNAERFLIYHAGDKMTRPQARGKGHGKTSVIAKTAEVFKTCLESRHVPFYYGVATATSRKFGQLFLNYLDGGKVVMWRIARDQLFGSKGAWKQAVGQMLRPLKLIVITHENVAMLDGFSERASPSYDSLIRRDGKYLRWRYLDHPGQKYHVVALISRNVLLGWSAFSVVGEVVRWGDALFLSSVKSSDVLWMLRKVAADLGDTPSCIEGWFTENVPWWRTVLIQCGFKPESEPNDLSLQIIPIAPNRAYGMKYYTWGDTDLF